MTPRMLDKRQTQSQKSHISQKKGSDAAFVRKIKKPTFVVCNLCVHGFAQILALRNTISKIFDSSDELE